jgi:ABC-type amino acid transport substrate-binding protein
VRRIRRVGFGIVVAAVLGAAVLSAGCGSSDTGTALKAKVAPPVIGKAGVLRAAIDLSYPPFGGADKGTKAGLDVDVASALAEKLGLKLEIVDAKPEAGAVLLRDKQADVMIAALPIDRAVQLDVAFAGSYANDGPAVFGLSETTMTIATLGGRKVAVQKESAAYWLLAEEYGEDALTIVPKLSAPRPPGRSSSLPATGSSGRTCSATSPRRASTASWLPRCRWVSR